MNQPRAFKDDIARLLQTGHDTEIVGQLAKLAALGATQNKETRINTFLAYIKQECMETITLSDRTYDTLELLIALVHLKRAEK